jgi:hypothetical protein
MSVGVSSVPSAESTVLHLRGTCAKQDSANYYDPWSVQPARTEAIGPGGPPLFTAVPHDAPACVSAPADNAGRCHRRCSRGLRGPHGWSGLGCRAYAKPARPGPPVLGTDWARADVERPVTASLEPSLSANFTLTYRTAPRAGLHRRRGSHRERLRRRRGDLATAWQPIAWTKPTAVCGRCLGCRARWTRFLSPPTTSPLQMPQSAPSMPSARVTSSDGDRWARVASPELSAGLALEVAVGPDEDLVAVRFSASRDAEKVWSSPDGAPWRVAMSATSQLTGAHVMVVGSILIASGGETSGQSPDTCRPADEPHSTTAGPSHEV